MSIEENRNCNNIDNDNCDYQIDNDMSCSIRNKMLEDIKAKNFSIIELSLYLNTHPDDSKALALHRRYCKELKELKDKYQKVYGPLSIYYPCNKWRWLEEPWPWEGGMN